MTRTSLASGIRSITVAGVLLIVRTAAVSVLFEITTVDSSEVSETALLLLNYKQNICGQVAGPF